MSSDPPPVSSSAIQPDRRFEWSVIVGYDFFISYRRADATRYAAALARLLRRADFRCFLDDNDAAPGTPLTARLRRALLRSKKLIVVASPKLVDSVWVPEELRLYSKTRRDIIPINIESGLQTALEHDDRFKVLRERDSLWIDEAPGVGPGAEPSAHVIGGLQKNFTLQRANRNLRLIATAVMIAIVGLAGAAYWQMRLAQERLALVQSQAAAAEARRQIPQELHTAMLTSMRAFDIEPSLDAEIALAESLSRAARIKRYVPCGAGQKAVGVAFSSQGDALLAIACLGFESGTARTSVRVIGLGGRELKSIEFKGDGRALSFGEPGKLSVGTGVAKAFFDVNTGRPVDAATKQQEDGMAVPEGGSNSSLEPINSPCMQQHPKSVRYFQSARTQDGGLVAYTTETNQIIVERVAAKACDKPLEAHTHNVLAMAWSPDGRFLASAGAIADADDQHGAVLWDLQQFHPLATTLVTQSRTDGLGNSPAIALSADGKSWLYATFPNKVVWDGQPLELPSGVVEQSFTSAAIRPDAVEALVGTSDGTLIRIVRKDMRHTLSILPGSLPSLRELKYAGNQAYALDQKGTSWLVANGVPREVARTAMGDTSSCRDSSSWGPFAIIETADAKGEYSVTFRDLDAATARRVTLASGTSQCGSLAYAPSAGVAVRTSAEYGPIVVFRTHQEINVATFDNPLRSSESGLRTVLRHAHLTENGTRLVVSSNSSSLALLELEAGRMVARLDSPDVTAVALSSAGKHALATSGSNLLLWNLDPKGWRKIVRDIAGREVTGGR